ncbi:MAG TPA: short-chain dehydrogenase [Ignavibacteriales bacterium]|nr:short-chain dehydrogenase [Ignavibacteriales bacterium]
MKNQPNGIWITGASSGIGKAAAKEFARTGSKVFVSSRRKSELERLNTELNNENLSVEIFPCNIASSSNVNQTTKKILAINNIDCIINNAGITSFKLAEENSINEIDDIISTNLLGPIYSIKSVLPSMIKQGGGTIINILSVVTKKVFSQSSAYSASKHGLIGYTNSLREEVRKHNVRIINVIPGATQTPMWNSEVREKYGDRMMTPEEIAQVIVWLYLQKGNLVTEEIVLRPILGDL